ncbi:MAG: ABC transporter ATP-binding protein [Phycisphaerales bacterium]|nr:ABC transporter ATP-binding protein [Phycisphaerales bacterium]
MQAAPPVTSAPPPILQATALRFGYPHARVLLDGVDFTARAGELVAIVGPNGAGKSTLLRLLAGLLSPTAGTITLAGRKLRRMRATTRARQLALLPQNPPTPADITVAEVVRLGRYPYLGMHVFESPDDLAVVDNAMKATGVDVFATRRVTTLSGGEAQRVHLAACLAQQPRVLMLDEPTSDLDLAHQLRIFRLLRELTRRDQLAVVVVTHDLNLATRFADVACVLHHGNVVASGAPRDVLREAILGPVYGVRFAEVVASGETVLVAHERDASEGGQP